MNHATTTTPTANAIYLRVSTKKQGISRLGLDAQRAAITAHGGITGTEFLEIESGKRDDRPQLNAALEHVKRTGGTLVVASLDRLARNVGFLFRIKEQCEKAGIQIMALDVPEWNTLTVGLWAVIAQHERERISKRTKMALAEKRQRDGEWRAVEHLRTPIVVSSSKRTRVAKAQENPHTKQASMVARLLLNDGKSMRHVAMQLNAHGFATPRGAQGGQWSSQQVKRMMATTSPDLPTPTKRGRFVTTSTITLHGDTVGTARV